MLKNKNNNVFLAFVRAGLWEIGAQQLSFEEIDYSEVMSKARVQSVVGLVAAGLEHVEDFKETQPDVLEMVGQALLIEKRNIEVNTFIPKIVKRLKKDGIDALLVKGQGVAQCYHRPLWRASGDVDLLFDDDNYVKAKKVLLPISYDIAKEDLKKKHLAFKIMGVNVELHGKMSFALSRRVDMELDAVLNNCLKEGGVSTWRVDETDVLIPNPDNHVVLIFTHFLHHFFIEGVGLRQVCDWCRILWRYREDLDLRLLEQRLQTMGLMSEWRVFAALAVDALGMPVEAMPFYDPRYGAKGERALGRILECGNFGHNRDLSYHRKYSGLRYLVVAFWRRFWDFMSVIPVFPLDAHRFFWGYVLGKVR